jgi:hypothetical protein
VVQRLLRGFELRHADPEDPNALEQRRREGPPIVGVRIGPPCRKVLEVVADLVGWQARPLRTARSLRLRGVELAHRLLEDQGIPIAPVRRKGAFALLLDPGQAQLVGLRPSSPAIRTRSGLDVARAQADPLQHERHHRLVLVAAVALARNSRMAPAHRAALIPRSLRDAARQT